MRELHDHKINPANDLLTISAIDDPGPGGACHRYEISGFVTTTNPSARAGSSDLSADFTRQVLLFQNGPINEVGVNGVTHEALLAIIIDRMRSFQAGQYACRENALALTKLEEAQMWLLQRTRARMARGSEGAHEK